MRTIIYYKKNAAQVTSKVPVRVEGVHEDLAMIEAEFDEVDTEISAHFTPPYRHASEFC